MSSHRADSKGNIMESSEQSSGMMRKREGSLSILDGPNKRFALTDLSNTASEPVKSTGQSKFGVIGPPSKSARVPAESMVTMNDLRRSPDQTQSSAREHVPDFCVGDISISVESQLTTDELLLRNSEDNDDTQSANEVFISPAPRIWNAASDRLANDPRMCSEYVEDVMTHLRLLELRYMPKVNYMRFQKSINPHMRATLCDWLLEVVDSFKIGTRSLFIAVNYLDRLLSVMNVPRLKLQLVGMTCLYIAAKVEEVFPPELKEYIFIADNAFSMQQVQVMELIVLKALKFDMHPATVRDFCPRFLTVAEGTRQEYLLTQYLCELTLLEERFHLFPPSLISASALYVARAFSGHSEWPIVLQCITQYTPRDMYECSRELYKAFQHAKVSPFRTVYDKYAMLEQDYVSQMPVTRMARSIFGE